MNTMQALEALFDSYEQTTIQPRIKTYPVDPLALVIHWNNGNLSPDSSLKNWSAGYDIVSSLTNPEDVSHAAYLISDAAIEKAQEIRDFYKQKYAYSLMMGEENLSPFQTSLVKFLASDNQNSLNMDNVGMVLSLPRMYEEDHKIFELMKQFVGMPAPSEDRRKTGEYGQCKLTFITKRTTKFQTAAAKHDYWFKNSKGYLFRIVMPMHTMESTLMDKVLDLNNNTIDFSGTFCVKRLFGNNFYYAYIFGRYDI
jgi:hypothetical protein